MKSIPQSPSETGSLISCHLLEVGKDGSLLWTWSYPSLDNRLRKLCLKKCQLLLNLPKSGVESREGLRIFRFFHLDGQWFYIYFSGNLSTLPSSLPDGPVLFSEVKQVGVLVGASDFNPDKYDILEEILYRSYLKTENPSVVLQQFLSLVVEGKCLISKKKMFVLTDYDTNNPFSQHCVKEMICRFGLESILIYTALTRKRRIVVYHYDIDVLMQVILSMPALVQDSLSLWDVIYPWIDLSEEEISYFKNLPFYVLGCTHAGVEHRADLYDIFVNIPAAEIGISPHAKEAVAMNKTHKVMALFMMQLANKEEIPEDEVVQEIFKKSQELVDKKTPLQKAQGSYKTN